MSLILTQAGLAALAEAESTGSKVQATHMAVGDGDGATPEHTAASTALDNETWRGALQSITINEQGETEAGQQVIFEAHVPMTVGGWYIRECALYAADVLLAIGPHPTLYKPAPEDPTKMEHIIKAVVTFGNADVVSLIVDPAVVLASQEHVATKVAEHNADATSHADIRDEIDAMAEAMENDTHAARTDNPHATTKAHVGLGNIPNAVSDAVDSTSSAQLATSAAAKLAYDRGSAGLNAANDHAGRKDNPHDLTLAQINAAAANHTHAVSYRSSRTTTGSWSLTGCTVGVPVYVTVKNISTSTGYFRYRVTSGSNGGSTGGDGYIFGSQAGASTNSPHTIVIIPTATTVTLEVTAVLNTTAYAYY